MNGIEWASECAYKVMGFLYNASSDSRTSSARYGMISTSWISKLPLKEPSQKEIFSDSQAP